MRKLMRASTVFWVITLFVLSAGTSIGAGSEVEIKRLKEILAVINQELNAAYQQYQLVAEARRDSLVVRFNVDAAPMGEPPDLLEAIQSRIDEQRRDHRLAHQMDQLIDKIEELQARKKPIMERIYQLIEESVSVSGGATPPAESGTSPAPTLY